MRSRESKRRGKAISNGKLKGRMVEMGFTQRTLAQRIGMNKNTLNAKLNGKSNFDTDEISRMCEALDIRTSGEMCAMFFTEPEAWKE